MKKQTLAIVLSLMMGVALPAVISAESSVYEGKGAGLNGDITVAVTLEDGAITAVEVKDHSETPGVCDPALEQLPAAIVAAGNTEVETVSGATFTSNGILEAVDNALKEAGIVTEDDAASEMSILEQSEAFLQKNNEYWAEVSKQYAPEIRTLKNGIKVQRTPTEYQCYNHAHPVEGGIAYNNRYLNADNRGCNACHVDLQDTMRNMDYAHPTIWNDGYYFWMDVNQCQICHWPGHYEFEPIMHGIHYGAGKEMFEKMGGTCMSCHSMSTFPDHVQLWDEVKYTKMLGINNVADVQGEFDFNQDVTQDIDHMFSYNWTHSHWDNLRRAMGKYELDLGHPEEVSNEFELEIGGLVNKPYKEKLVNLIAECEADGKIVNKISKIHCAVNHPGAGGISNVEITGIPLTWLIERAGGVKDGVTGFACNRGDDGSFRALPIEKYDHCYVVYKIGDDYLDGDQGMATLNWFEGNDAQIFIKQIAGFDAIDDDLDYPSYTKNGWFNFNREMVFQDGTYNKPNVTILEVPDGMIIETGKPFTFEGYADAFDEAVTKIEFSMDMGKTWTAFDLGQTDPFKWVYWHFTWTPESDGSYVLMVRGTTETGMVSNPNHLHKIMVTAHSNLEDL